MDATGPLRSRLEPIALGGLVVFQLLIGVWIRGNGFVAISDDDYARVVIAQQFVESPSWDPSGTSWLPFPFLHSGVVLKAFSASLECARVWALLSACVGTLLLYEAARRWGTSVAFSLAGAVACALLPSSAFLAVATVPEYLTAALIVFGVTSIVAPRGREKDLMFGALCLFLACASRYEAWPAALAASGLFFVRFFWGARSPFSLGAAVLALLFPVAWLVHGVIHHDSALFFVKRVTDYKDALGGASGRTDAAFVYLKALFLAEPEVMGAFAFVTALSFLKGSSRDGKRIWVAPWVPLGVMFVTLVLSALRSGAPTHHPERALLSIWLLGALTTARLLDRSALDHARLRKTLVVGILLGFSLRLGGAFERQPFADRSPEERLGSRLGRKLTSASDPIGLSLSDYGYFAVMAAAEHPGRFTIFETHDPREVGETQGSPLARFVERGGCVYVTMKNAPLAEGHVEVESVEQWSVRQAHRCRFGDAK